MSSPKSTSKRSATRSIKPAASSRTRFDFKGTDSTVELNEKSIELATESDQRLKAVTQVLEEKLVKRKVSLKALDYGKVEEATKGTARQTVSLHVGINDEKAREIGKYIKGLGAQGRAAPGAGRPAARHRQEARRPADRDPEARGARLRHPAPVHELPGLSPDLGEPPRDGQAACCCWPQAGDALLGRRVRREEVGEVHLAAATSGLMMYAVACAGSTFIGTCLA